MRDLIVYGHYALDRIIKEGATHDTLGGPPAYMTPFLQATGADFRVVSVVGTDFLYATHNPVRTSTEPTTRFELNYSHGERIMRCPAVCESISLEDVTEDAIVSVLCGVMNEIPPNTVKAIRKRSNIVIADMQGFCRRQGTDGTVQFVSAQDAFGPLLGDLDYLKMSDAEAQTTDIESLAQRVGVLVTDAKGCTYYHGVRTERVNGTPATVVDSTGAGDAFLAGFSYGIAHGWEPVRAIKLANAFGAIAVQHLGVPSVTAVDIAQSK